MIYGAVVYDEILTQAFIQNVYNKRIFQQLLFDDKQPIFHTHALGGAGGVPDYYEGLVATPNNSPIQYGDDFLHIKG